MVYESDCDQSARRSVELELELEFKLGLELELELKLELDLETNEAVRQLPRSYSGDLSRG